MIHETGIFPGKNIFSQAWKSDKAPKAIIFIVHGLGEHSSRYDHISTRFVRENIHVFSLDLPGHGKSAGKNAYIDSFDHCIKIIADSICHLKQIYPQLPFFLLGHSMGGALAAYYVLKKQPDFAGVILSSAALKISDSISPFLVALSGVMGKLVPKLPTIKLKTNGLSHDPDVIKQYETDPLVHHGKIPARTGAEINRSIRYNQSNASQFSAPLLMIHGKADALADYRGSKEFYQKVSSANKRLNLYDGLYHELMNEPEKETIFRDIFEWIYKILS